MPAKEKRRVLLIGGQFTGLFCGRDLKKQFHTTIVDVKEFFEYTPGILRCFVKPAHFDSLSFTLQPVIERSMGIKFIWAEVTELDEKKNRAKVFPIYSGDPEFINFDYCIICSGCNFNPLSPIGESLWFPTVHACNRPQSEWAHIDERYIEGRRRHILEEYHKIAEWNKKGAKLLIAGAGFIGVEWATEIEHFFPNIQMAIIDFLPKCLGPLPASAAEYCVEYMDSVGIKQYYGMKYEPKDPEFWKKIEMPEGADYTYCTMGVKASNYFMPQDMLSEKGPGGGKWIHMNKYLQVTGRPLEGKAEGAIWGDGNIFAVGDCNYGCIASKDYNPGTGMGAEVIMHGVPKISYPGEEQALHACRSVETLDHNKYHNGNKALYKTWWPWGAGMFATSLGPHDACFVAGANHVKNSGHMVNWWLPAALQKEIIETSKVNECKNGIIGICIWHFVHHTPVHLFGDGPLFP
jgi:NADH dehydrogenase FAD-containing subunit